MSRMNIVHVVVITIIQALFGGKRKINCHWNHLTVGPGNEKFRRGCTISEEVLSELDSRGTQRAG